MICTLKCNHRIPSNVIKLTYPLKCVTVVISLIFPCASTSQRSCISMGGLISDPNHLATEVKAEATEEQQARRLKMSHRASQSVTARRRKTTPSFCGLIA